LFMLAFHAPKSPTNASKELIIAAGVDGKA
jgi:hypothetical protein